MSVKKMFQGAGPSGIPLSQEFLDRRATAARAVAQRRGRLAARLSNVAMAAFPTSFVGTIVACNVTDTPHTWVASLWAVPVVLFALATATNRSAETAEWLSHKASYEALALKEDIYRRP